MDKNITRFDTTFGCTKDAEGAMSIILYQLSLQFTPTKQSHLIEAEIVVAQKAMRSMPLFLVLIYSSTKVST